MVVSILFFFQEKKNGQNRMENLPLDPLAFYFGKGCLFKDFSMSLIVETHVLWLAHDTSWKEAFIFSLLVLMA